MKLVILLGSSSAGKTTLCSELAASYHWKVVNQDEFGARAHKAAFEKDKPFLLSIIENTLSATTLVNNLSPYMTAEQINHFAFTGELTFKNGEHFIEEHQFINPELPDLENILEKVKITEKEIGYLSAQLRHLAQLGKECIEERRKIKIIASLQAASLIRDLSSYMIKEQVIHFAVTGKLNLKQNNNSIENYSFPDPRLPDLEKKLKRAGINESDIPTLAAQLRQISQLADNVNRPFSGPDDFFTQLIEHALKEGNGEDIVVIDMVPPANETSSVIFDSLQQCVTDYHLQYPQQSLEIVTVLAYCPPLALSARIIGRNEKAKAENKFEELREGAFPFAQSAQLMNAKCKENIFDEKDNKWRFIAELSRAQVFEIANKHTQLPLAENENASLVLVDTTDPSAFGNLDSEEEALNCNNPPLVAFQPIVNVYHDLIDKFGFLTADHKVQLCVNPDQYDIIIDMSKEDVQTLAKNVVNAIEKLEQNEMVYKNSP